MRMAGHVSFPYDSALVADRSTHRFSSSRLISSKLYTM